MSFVTKRVARHCGDEVAELLDIRLTTQQVSTRPNLLLRLAQDRIEPQTSRSIQSAGFRRLMDGTFKNPATTY